MSSINIGIKGRSESCPVCMRRKETAIAEQLQMGKTCGHTRCEFQTEIELACIELKAFRIGQNKPCLRRNSTYGKNAVSHFTALCELVDTLVGALEAKIQNDAGQPGTMHSQLVNDKMNQISEGFGNQFSMIRKHVSDLTSSLLNYSLTEKTTLSNYLMHTVSKINAQQDLGEWNYIQTVWKEINIKLHAGLLTAKKTLQIILESALKIKKKA